MTIIIIIYTMDYLKNIIIMLMNNNDNNNNNLCLGLPYKHNNKVGSGDSSVVRASDS